MAVVAFGDVQDLTGDFIRDNYVDAGSAEITFPEQIKVIREVTDDDAYKNVSLAADMSNTAR